MTWVSEINWRGTWAGETKLIERRMDAYRHGEWTRLTTLCKRGFIYTVILPALQSPDQDLWNPPWILILNDFAFTIGIINYWWAIPVHNIFTLQNKIPQYCWISPCIKKSYTIDIIYLIVSPNFPKTPMFRLLISRLEVRVLPGAPANSKLVSSTFRFQFSHLLTPGFK